jgi:hypothetical protein
MVDAGLLERRVYRGEQRSHNEYVLAEAGIELLPILHNLAIWGERHTPAPERRAHMTILHSTCGGVTTSAEVCSNCGERLTLETVQWKRQWISGNPIELQAAEA